MGIKGVKSGNMAKLRGLTEKDLFTMSRQEMEQLLYSTSKNITASVRKLKTSKYGAVSQFLGEREKNKYPMPREIKLKTAKRMPLEQLKQELRDLSYTANLKTYNVSGTQKMMKQFKIKTGRDLTDLIDVEKTKDVLIDKLIEDHYKTSGIEYTKEQIIAKYGNDNLIEQSKKIISDRWEKIREDIEVYGSESVLKTYDITKEDIAENIDDVEMSIEREKQKASKDLSNADMYNLV